MEAAVQTSTESVEQRGERCFALDKAIKDGLRAGREAMWDVAKNLYHFHTEGAWSALDCESLAEWLADPEVGMTKQTYYRLVGAYEKLAVTRSVPETELRQLEVSKVDVVLPAVTSGTVKLDDALDDARALGWRDLREKYGKSKKDSPSAGTDDDDDADKASDVPSQPDPKRADSADFESGPVTAADLGGDEGPSGETDITTEDAFVRTLIETLRECCGRNDKVHSAPTEAKIKQAVGLAFERTGMSLANVV